MSGSFYILPHYQGITGSFGRSTLLMEGDKLPFQECEYCNSRIPVNEWTCGQCGAPTSKSHFVGNGELVYA